VRRGGIRLAAVVVVAVTALALFGPGAAPVNWKPFSPDTLRAELGHRPVMLDFTADWCPNCKLLEHTALAQDNLARWRDEYGLTLMQADLTRENPEAMELLRALGSQSIPVVAVFPPGDGAGEPLVLRDLFTTAQMEEALRSALGR
jgi:thiol:disulfide interchange protein DsbD